MPRKASTDTRVKPKRTRKPRKTTVSKQTAKSTTSRKKKEEPEIAVKKSQYDEKPKWLFWLIAVIVAVTYGAAFYYFFIRPDLYKWDVNDIHFYKFAVHGIDVSHYQGDINWTTLKKEEFNGIPLHFIMMKATEGSDMLDEKFHSNFASAKENGFIRGAYHFFSTLSPADKQADFYIENVKLEPNDLPPVLDVERRGDYGEDSLRIEVKNWLSKVEEHYGVKPIIYASYRFKEKYLSDSLLNTYPYWIAHYYVDTLEYKGEWAFWQYTDVGSLSGIEGKVDMNVFNGDMQKLLEMTIRQDTLPQAPTSIP